MAGGLLRTSAGQERPVEDGQLRVPGWIGNGDGEEAGVFVVHVGEFDALVRAEIREPQALPTEQVLRHRESDPWALG